MDAVPKATPASNSSYNETMFPLRHLTSSAVALGVSLVVTAAARAQEPVDIPPVKADKPWIGVMIAIVLLLCAGAVSVITPKRTHQD